MFPSRYLLRGMLLTAVVAGLAACKPRTAARQLPPAGRIIALTDSVLRNGGSDTIRFGHLGSGEIALSRLRIENRTEKPVVVTSYRTSCGCTSLEFDKQPVPPGGTLPVERSRSTPAASTDGSSKASNSSSPGRPGHSACSSKPILTDLLFFRQYFLSLSR